MAARMPLKLALTFWVLLAIATAAIIYLTLPKPPPPTPHLDQLHRTDDQRLQRDLDRDLSR